MAKARVDGTVVVGIQGVDRKGDEEKNCKRGSWGWVILIGVSTIT